MPPVVRERNAYGSRAEVEVLTVCMPQLLGHRPRVLERRGTGEGGTFKERKRKISVLYTVDHEYARSVFTIHIETCKASYPNGGHL